MQIVLGKSNDELRNAVLSNEHYLPELKPFLFEGIHYEWFDLVYIPISSKQREFSGQQFVKSIKSFNSILKKANFKVNGEAVFLVEAQYRPASMSSTRFANYFVIKVSKTGVATLTCTHSQ
jgi:hypothetical protein